MENHRLAHLAGLAVEGHRQLACLPRLRGHAGVSSREG
jgi:hypothetical protein